MKHLCIECGKQLKNFYARRCIECFGKTISRIQMVYEDNIKKYGTLTCYLCLNKIPFGLDHLEHQIPLSRGGTNDYENLAVACCQCNCKKGKKTVSEYKEKNYHA